MAGKFIHQFWPDSAKLARLGKYQNTRQRQVKNRRYNGNNLLILTVQRNLQPDGQDVTMTEKQ